MARRKKSYDPNQLSLFDYFRAPAAPKEKKLEDIIVKDLPDASPIEGLEPVISSGDKPEPVPPPLQADEPPQTTTKEESVRLLETVINLAPTPEQDSEPIQEQNSDYEPDTSEAENLAEPEIVAPDEDVEVPTSSEPVRLGINQKGDSVYIMPDGSRMHSPHLGLLRVVDGDKLAPEILYVQNRHEFLTIQEVAHFRNETDLRVEGTNVRPTDRPSGNRKNSSQARNNSGREVGGIHQPGLFDTGSLGTEPAGRTEETGSPRQDSIRSEIIRPAADRIPRPDESGSEGDGEQGFERLGDIAGDGHRHEPENYRISEVDHLGSGGPKAKYADNIAAIRLLQQLQGGNAEIATPDEKKILVRYVGWGGLPQVFDAKNEQWAKEYQELQILLPTDEYQAARRSTQDAHYTSETVIRCSSSNLI